MLATGIGFPTVPKGRARVRTIVTATHTREELDRALEAFRKAGRKLALVWTGEPGTIFFHATAFCEAMHKVGAGCRIVTIEGGGHGMNGWENTPAMQHWKPEMIAWLKKRLNVK